MEALAVMSPPEAVYGRSRQNFEHIVGYLDSREACAMTHSELERELEKKGRELMRLLLQEHLDARGPGECAQPVRDADGIERTRVRLQERELETVFGPVSTQRAGYGKKGSESLHPQDAELNLPNEKYSYELRRRVAEEASKSSFDETCSDIGRTTGGRVPKRQIEELAARAAQDFDAFYEARHEQAAMDKQTGSVLAISVDGKGVVMRTQDLREQTRKAALDRKHKLCTRLSKGEKKNAKRMATVAAVYTIAPLVRQPEDVAARNPNDPEPPHPRPEDKRVWASIEKTPEEVIEQAFQEACYRDPACEKIRVALVDGNKAQIRILRYMAKKNGVDLTIIVDIVHVIEYLWKAGRAFHSETSPELENWVQYRLLEILKGNAGYVAGGMCRSATLRGLVPAERKPVDACARYLLNNSPYLRYDRYLSQGLPIATGVIEGACRHLVNDRMAVTGARWSLSGAEAVLRLRALRSSHDFDEYWTFHEAKEYERNHKTLYADGVVPPTIQPRQIRKRDHLKAIE